MTPSPSASTETPAIIPRRRSQRLWLYLIIGIVVVAIGWISFVRNMDRRYREQQVAQYSDLVPQSLGAQNNAPVFTNQRLVQARAAAPSTQQNSAPIVQYAPQSRPQATTVYANPTQTQDPAEATAAHEINQLRNQLQSANSDEKKELRKSLTDAVAKLFDLRHAAQAKQVEKLEAELAEAKELHKKRGERKDEIVERRISELLQSADDLAWNREIAKYSNATGYTQPNGFTQSIPPDILYTAPASPSYPNGYRGGAKFAPSQPFPNALPQSSTPPQFIPLNSSSGQTTFLQSNPSATSLLPTGPKFNNTAPSDDALMTTTPTAGVPSVTEPTEPSRVYSSSQNSKALIEAAYDYEESLEMALETKKLADQKKVVSMQEFAASKRKVARAKALWGNICREIETQRKLLEGEITGNELLIRESGTQSSRSEIGIRMLKLQAEFRLLTESDTWAKEFQKQSLEPLEKQIEQSVGAKAEAKKSESPSEPVASE